MHCCLNMIVIKSVLVQNAWLIAQRLPPSLILVGAFMVRALLWIFFIHMLFMIIFAIFLIPPPLPLTQNTRTVQLLRECQDQRRGVSIDLEMTLPHLSMLCQQLVTGSFCFSGTLLDTPWFTRPFVRQWCECDCSFYSHEETVIWSWLTFWKLFLACRMLTIFVPHLKRVVQIFMYLTLFLLLSQLIS